MIIIESVDGIETGMFLEEVSDGLQEHGITDRTDEGRASENRGKDEGIYRGV